MELIKCGGTLAIIATLLFSPNLSRSQEANFNNEAIWASGTFRTEYVWGIRSMANGKHYTTQEYDENEGSCIIKWSYKTGQIVDTLLTSNAVVRGEVMLSRLMFTLTSVKGGKDDLPEQN